MIRILRKWIKLRNRLQSVFASETGRRSLKISHFAFIAVIVAWLGYKLYLIGWQEVISHLPDSPLFYLIFPLLYLTNPVIQIIIYRTTWAFNTLKSLPIFFIKRVMNAEVLGYTGEVYLYAWLRNNVREKKRKIVETIRDYNIISAGSTNILSVILLISFIIVGQVEFQQLMGDLNLFYFATGAVAVVVFFSLAWHFREYVYSTSLRMTLFVGGMHMIRMISGLLIQVVLWMIAIPEVPAGVWITYTALMVVVSRIPVSNKQLIFVGLGVGMSGNLGVSEAAVFGLFGSIAALEKIFSFVLFTVFALGGRFKTQPGEVKSEFSLFSSGKKSPV